MNYTRYGINVTVASKAVSNLSRVMRTMMTIAIVLACLVGAKGEQSSSGFIKAWSSTNGSFGKVGTYPFNRPIPAR